MTEGRYREEVFNVLLAQLLHERGVISAPEQLLQRTASDRRKMPDVLVTFQGLRVVVEGKVADQPGASDAVRANAMARVEQGVGHLAIALLYPPELRRVSFEELKQRLRGCTLRMAVYSETGESGWVEGDLNHLIGLLRRTYEQLVEEDVVARAVAVLNEAVEGFAQALLGGAGNVERTATALGIAGAPEEKQAEGEPGD